LKKINALILLLLLPLFYGCTTVQDISSLFASPTPTVTQTATPTLTATPTPTLTPTLSLAERPIDLETLYSLPSSYFYLQNHLEEFVQAPDLIHDRTEFDAWFLHQLAPALGPVAERPLTLHTYTAGDSITGFDAYAVPRTQPVLNSGSIPFFYFISDDVIYPVPCFNFDRGYENEPTYSTFCIILFDFPNAEGLGVHSLDNLSDEGMYFYQANIYTNLTARPDLDFGETGDRLITDLGLYDDHNNWIRFGFGFIVMVPVSQ